MHKPAAAIVTAVAAVAALNAGVPTASADTVIDFNNLTHGRVVNTQYQQADGVTIAAVDYHNSLNKAVVFDSDTTRQTSDPDLTGPFDAGNIKDEDLGNLLIIQEHGPIQNGLATDPDDEGRRSAGHFQFIFDNPINSFGFDLVDVEGEHEFNGGYFATFRLADQEVASVNFSELYDHDNSIVWGDNSANRITPFTTAELGVKPFDEVEIGLGGSGALDNVRFVAAPTPAAAGAGLMLLGGLLAKRRRRA